MRLALVMVLAGCFEKPSDDVVGPYTGEVHRFVVDGISPPRSSDEARRLGDDLDGDGRIDNQLGSVIATLISQDNGNVFIGDVIASGVVASSVELLADDLFDDKTVSISYFGAAGEPATAMGADLFHGQLRSNRTDTTRVPGRAILHLPVFADADPTVVQLDAMQIDLLPDGNGGYDGLVRGAVLPDNAFAAIAPGIVQMLDADPTRHEGFVALFDVRDGEISPADVRNASLIKSLLFPDVRVNVDGVTRDAISLGFGIHLAPCAEGNCALAAPVHTCHDRIVDGDESDVDCGGSCLPCKAASACGADADCQTSCGDDGRCVAPTCTDGIQDGYESGIDCGANCRACS